MINSSFLALQVRKARLSSKLRNSSNVPISAVIINILPDHLSTDRSYHDIKSNTDQIIKCLTKLHAKHLYTFLLIFTCMYVTQTLHGFLNGLTNLLWMWMPYFIPRLLLDPKKPQRLKPNADDDLRQNGKEKSSRYKTRRWSLCHKFLPGRI